MSTQIEIPGYVAGSWVIDPAHSEVSYEVALLGLFKSRGAFDEFEGTIVTAPNPLDSSVNAVIKTASVNTKNKRRDGDLRKKPYLAAESHPTITFASTGVRAEGAGFVVEGDLTIRAVTKRVALTLESQNIGAEGAVAFTARTEISCDDFGVTRGPARPFIGPKVGITLKIQANKQG